MTWGEVILVVILYGSLFWISNKDSKSKGRLEERKRWHQMLSKGTSVRLGKDFRFMAGAGMLEIDIREHDGGIELIFQRMVGETENVDGGKVTTYKDGRLSFRREEKPK